MSALVLCCQPDVVLTDTPSMKCGLISTAVCGRKQDLHILTAMFSFLVGFVWN